ncbi:PadR family transcriptional regulator [Streptomyces umbrinus]|uniref:PadR family transcriptional regulator n=1 Tax=Streptomyces umbrinus TaxID=67370 RepID=UPI003C2C21FE
MLSQVERASVTAESSAMNPVRDLDAVAPGADLQHIDRLPMNEYSCKSSRMSSIRLFILDTFARNGEMHGHRVRLQAEREHLHLWTDVSVGSLYQAIKRLLAEGLLEEVRTEKEGNLPERQVYGITGEGRLRLKELQSESLRHIWMKPDPFDLALTRLDPEKLDELHTVITSRLDELAAMLSDTEALNANAIDGGYLTVSEALAVNHSAHRLRAEIAWLQEVLDAVPVIVTDERTRQPDTL